MLNPQLVSEALTIPSPITELNSSVLTTKKLKLFLKRDDLIHPEISGNKWRKLYLNLLEAKKLKKETILTFGGAFSNHIYATAAACNLFGINSIGIIRGEYVDPKNSTINFAKSQGMEIVRVSKAIYGSDKDVLAMQYPDAYIIPEGGNNELGRMGMKFLAEELNQSFQNEECIVVLPIGTGCTMTGLIQNLDSNFSVLGINVLRNKSIDKEISDLLLETNVQYEINHDYHFGAYAKTTPELIKFTNQFFDEHKINLDPIYTAKSMYAIFDLMAKGEFPEGKKMIAIHTGGLQGIIPYNRLNELKIRL